jgi:VanZ family protein
MTRFRVTSAILWTFVILLLCWTPDIYLPVEEDNTTWFEIAHLDKIVHAGIFTVFSVLWLRAIPGGNRRFLAVLLAGTALGALTEVVQNLPIVHREGEIGDFLVDLLGVVVGFPIYAWLDRIQQRYIARGPRHRATDRDRSERPVQADV